MSRRGLCGLAIVTATVLATPACGPIEYLANVPLSAAGVIGEAKHLHAEKHAPYEMTAAEEYLHHARELAGQARFQSSVRFARMATKLGVAARRIAEAKAAAPAEKIDEKEAPK